MRNTLALAMFRAELCRAYAAERHAALAKRTRPEVKAGPGMPGAHVPASAPKRGRALTEPSSSRD